MKSDKARKVTSREYIMKLIYQIEMNKGYRKYRGKIRYIFK